MQSRPQNLLVNKYVFLLMSDVTSKCIYSLLFFTYTNSVMWVLHTCDGLQTLCGVSLQGGSSGGGYLRCGKQHSSRQSSSQPQSHSSPTSTTPFPQMADCGSATPRISLTFVSNTVLSQIINILIQYLWVIQSSCTYCKNNVRVKWLDHLCT